MDPSFNELSVELTHKCALSCSYCSSSASINDSMSIDLGRLRDVLIEVQSKFGVRTISLSGGETFLYDHFWELHSFLNNSGFQILIYSSGVTLDEMSNRIPIAMSTLRRLISIKDLKIFLNIQGHERALVEGINGIPGSHELIRQTAENILSAGIYLGAHVVPFRANYKHIKDIFEYCANAHFNEVRFLRFVPQGRGADIRLYNTPAEFAQINENLGDVIRIAAKGDRKTKVTLGHPINFLFLTGDQNLCSEEYHCCRGGVDAPLIQPDGNVSMCPAWKNLAEFSAGNVYRSSFEEIWGSPYFRIFREFVSQGYRHINEPCHSCPHLHDCRGKCVAQRLLAARNVNPTASLEESIPYSPDPQCFRDCLR